MTEQGGIYVNYPYSDPHSSYPGDGRVYYDHELFPSGGFLESGSSHFTRLGLPSQPSSPTGSSSSRDSVIHIDVSI